MYLVPKHVLRSGQISRCSFLLKAAGGPDQDGKCSVESEIDRRVLAIGPSKEQSARNRK